MTGPLTQLCDVLNQALKDGELAEEIVIRKVTELGGQLLITKPYTKIFAKWGRVVIWPINIKGKDAIVAYIESAAGRKNFYIFSAVLMKEIFPEKVACRLTPYFTFFKAHKIILVG
ncbi:MAG: hypothetical protein OXR68_05200 [Alphaproteobacteria bacterium]|nr:hypothetical protein [Alphaproteobacteria bacterium]MDD9920000.1 hypothetical protein [Alphaproteobacteria bacterium]